MGYTRPGVMTGDPFFTSYFVPSVVLSVAVGPGRRRVVNLAVHSSLHVLNQDPKHKYIHRFFKRMLREM